MSIVEDTEMENEPGNFGCFKLILANSDGTEIASYSFAAHYGIHVDAVDCDGDGVPEFVVQAHIGPATGPSIKELTVLRYRPIDADWGFLEEVLQMPLAGQAGPTVGWWYKLQFQNTDQKRTIGIHLELEHDPTEGWDAYLPAERERMIILSRKAVSFMENGSVALPEDNRQHTSAGDVATRAAPEK